MNRCTRFAKPLLALGLAVITFVAVALAVALWPEKQASATLALSRPPFLEAAQASQGQAVAQDIGAKLDEEAGMSAYFKANGPIDLGLVKNALRTVEVETPTYIIGSVDVPDYPEDYDAHIYVHVDGWFLAYYLRTDIPAKIIDTRGYVIDSTVLESALAVVSGAAGVPFSAGTHYDFRYPNATHILLVAENQSDGDCFNIQVPSEYGYFDRGFAVYDNYYFDVYLDGVEVSYIYYTDVYDIAYGSISSSQLLPDVMHTMCVSTNGGAYGVLVILYDETP
jgi:hypothetical protein